MLATEREAARVRHDEAKRVVDAYAVQVDTRRKRWAHAPDGRAANVARRDLSEALVQHDWAIKRERQAWRAWHGLTNE
jgi:hypothetical protein